ncbi:hypothetical protein HJC23_010189 [Cyclotella cryptica]|uniref:Uncharacterized protein n=1 Tax=Cyclotella cryptica TaxID=29204 RepID=A0ABD3PGS9_9STRA|eukprot:CCRYP_014739-RA/>CCRYP_014739-RA protein AED:0.36 eAED:0.36 QI:247/1/1/1/1/1/2/181/237
MTATSQLLWSSFIMVCCILPLSDSFSPVVTERRRTRIDIINRFRPSVRPHLYMTSSSSNIDTETTKELYNIKNSSWSSDQWNWGSAVGTGHDCAAICRRRWSDKIDRKKLVSALLEPAANHNRGEIPFEEVKLILGLTWQRAGRSNGYNKVLENMARAKRYEIPNDEVLSALNFITDIKDSFPSIARSKQELDLMNRVAGEILQYHHHMVCKEDVFRIRRVCAGMVLDAMKFVENGI